MGAAAVAAALAMVLADMSRQPRYGVCVWLGALALGIGMRGWRWCGRVGCGRGAETPPYLHATAFGSGLRVWQGAPCEWGLPAPLRA